MIFVIVFFRFCFICGFELVDPVLAILNGALQRIRVCYGLIVLSLERGNALLERLLGQEPIF